MKESTKKKWVPMVGALVAVFGSFAALFYLSISAFSGDPNQLNPSFSRFQQTPPAWEVNQSPVLPTPVIKKAPKPATWSKKSLRLDRQEQVGDILVTYRGKQGRAFRMDVIIPALDPQYTYLRNIQIETARKGFQIGAERFVLRSAGRGKLRLLHYHPAK